MGATEDDGEAEIPSGMQKVDALHMNMPDDHRFAVGWPGARSLYSWPIERLVDDHGDVAQCNLLCVPVRLALGCNDPFVHPLLFVEPPCLDADAGLAFRERAAQAAFQILRSPAVAFASPFVLALLAREQNSGIVILLPASKGGSSDAVEFGAVGAVVDRRVVEARMLRHGPENAKELAA